MPYQPTVLCCAKCDQHKPIDEFYGEHNTCKECDKAYMREWYMKRKVNNLLAEVLNAA